MRERIGELLKTVGLTPGLGNRYPHQLSGGQRQRVMIALALACRPSLVIADEPTTALDVVMQAQVLELLERLRAQLGLALILISHDLGVLAETCDRIAIMYAGRIVEIGSVDSVFAAPQHPYTKRLLDTLPVIGGRARAGDADPRRAPRPGRHARGMPLPPALSLCRRALPHRPGAARGPSRASASACHFAPWSEWPAAPMLRRPPEGGVMSEPLMEVRDLEVQFKVRRGVTRAVDGDLARVDAGARSSAWWASRAAASRPWRGRCSAWSSPPAGELTLHGGKVEGKAGVGELRRRVQMIFQDPYQTLNPRQRVRSIVAEPLVVQKVAAGRARGAGAPGAGGRRARPGALRATATRTSSPAASASGSRSPRRSCSSPRG